MKKIILFLGVITFVFSSFSYGYMSRDAMEKKLNELLKIIKQQQKEIEQLKKELEEQKQRSHYHESELFR